jgi:hypothetical protein
MKLYTDDNRHAGQNNNFDLKLIMFHDLCNKARVLYKAKVKAYFIILRSQALDHYNTNYRNIGQAASFNNLCNLTHNYFEGPKYVRKVQVTWSAELGLANSFILHFAC